MKNQTKAQLQNRIDELTRQVNVLFRENKAQKEALLAVINCGTTITDEAAELVSNAYNHGIAGTKAYVKGFINGRKDFYWTHLYNNDLDQLETLEEKVDFYNGYHDSLADKYGLERAVHTKASDLKDHYPLYIHD